METDIIALMDSLLFYSVITYGVIFGFENIMVRIRTIVNDREFIQSKFGSTLDWCCYTGLIYILFY